jgi:hypothetical protein
MHVTRAPVYVLPVQTCMCDTCAYVDVCMPVKEHTLMMRLQSSPCKSINDV